MSNFINISKHLSIPIYTNDQIINAIRREGLVDQVWGYETAYCIWVYTDDMKNDEVWNDFPTPLVGWKYSDYDNAHIEHVHFFLLEGYPERDLRNIECKLHD